MNRRKKPKPAKKRKQREKKQDVPKKRQKRPVKAEDGWDPSVTLGDRWALAQALCDGRISQAEADTRLKAIQKKEEIESEKDYDPSEENI